MNKYKKYVFVFLKKGAHLKKEVDSIVWFCNFNEYEYFNEHVWNEWRINKMNDNYWQNIIYVETYLDRTKELQEYTELLKEYKDKQYDIVPFSLFNDFLFENDIKINLDNDVNYIE